MKNLRYDESENRSKYSYSKFNINIEKHNINILSKLKTLYNVDKN